jgi:2-furoyl-CoA dehydrogenase FAD binding subunit
VKPVAFDYVAAHSLEEALAAIVAGGDDAKPIAGGQSLVPALNMRLVRPTLLVDLNRAGLDGITANGAVRVGATVRQAVLERSPHAHPLVREALPFVGHVVTRNRGTIGGSIAHADGSAELPLCLAALGGTAVVQGLDGVREIPAAELFVTHYLTTLQPGELLVETVWPAPAAGECSAFEELALRAGDYALAMVAVVLVRDTDGVVTDARVAVGAVTDTPTLLVDAAAMLVGTDGGADVAREVSAAAAQAVDPPPSIHASGAYLAHVTGVLTRRAIGRAS